MKPMPVKPAVLSMMASLVPCGGVLAQQASTPAVDNQQPQVVVGEDGAHRRGSDSEALAFSIQEPPSTALRISVDGWFDHLFRTDVDSPGGNNADVAVTRAGVGLTLSGAFNERLRWFVPVSYDFSHYDFTSAGGLVNAAPDVAPFDDGHILSFSPTLAYTIDEHWSVRGSLIVQSAFQGGADIGDSMTYGGAAAARYAFNKDLALTFGVAAKTRLEDSAIFVPVVGVEWQINDEFRLAGGFGVSGNRGPGIGLFYSPTDSLTFSFGPSFDFREYRLDENDNESSGGVFSDEGVSLIFGVDWKATENISVGLRAGATVWQEYEFKNSNGDTLHKEDAELTPMLGVNVTIRF